VANRMRRAVGLEPRDGVLVREVEEGSPAAAAGIREGDMIVEVAGHAIVEPDDVYDALGTANANGTLQVKLVRGADELTVEARFGGAPSSTEAGGPVH
jgi:S1-C subfamily serine protease